MNFAPALIQALRSARHIAVLTGAGASAESGLPTFRDVQTGLWSQFRPEDLATPEAFQRNPKLVWEWYAWRRSLVERAQPNPGHLMLAEMERRVPHFTLITQNVDGLHQLAGSRNVIELHGNIRRYKCFDCQAPYALDDADQDAPPRCPHCGGLIRPDVVWFGESLPTQAYWAALEAAQGCDVFFSIGTSGRVEPAASLPRVARRARATLVTINPDVEKHSESHSHAIHGKAGEVLPALVRAAWGERPAALSAR